jgi:hypothetical protein
MKNKNYYVYEHIRNDNNTVFYIGKGRGRRAYSPRRNPHHDRIVNKYGFTINIVKDNLSESEAFELEQELIKDYVFNKGYGIDIEGFRKPNSIYQLTNHTFGGDGSSGMVHTKEWCKQHSEDMMGEKNPMYGINVYDSFSEERMTEVKEKLSKTFSGKNNPMYGISPKERMDEETYNRWYKKRIENLQGEKNPNYGKHTLHDYYEKHPEEKQKLSRKGKQNGRCVPVDLYSSDNNFIKHFDYIGECAQYIKEQNNLSSNIVGMASNIRKAMNENKTYRNYIIKETI